MRTSSWARAFTCIGLLTVGVIFGRPTLISAALPPIDIAVKNWSFTPAAIDAKVGEPTTLHFTSTEGVHGVASADIGLANTTIVPGKTVEATFTPKTAGTFAVHCTIVCGEGHDTMAMTVKVAP